MGGHDAPGFHEPSPHESVVKRFARFPNVDVVPDSFAQAAPDTIAFLHIDLNSSKAEIATLDILFDWISPGGLVVFDDYGWSGYQAQQIAEGRLHAPARPSHPGASDRPGLLIKH